MFTRSLILITFALFNRNIMAIDISSTSKAYYNTTVSAASKNSIVFEDAITIYLSGTKGKSYDVYVENPDLSQKDFAIIASDGNQEIPFNIKKGRKKLSKPGIIFKKKNDSEFGRTFSLDIVFKTKDVNKFDRKLYLHMINFSIKEK